MLRNTEIGIAILAKTPGLSPVKTRLVPSISQGGAEEFQRLSLLAIEEVVSQLLGSHSGITAYWSVAEESSLDNLLWKKFDVIFQGDGEFGSRLYRTYSQMLMRHGFAIFVVSDSPQIVPAIFIQAIKILRQKSGRNRFVLGPSLDGGFYLFGGKQLLSEKFWMDIPFSHSETAQALCESLQSDGDVMFLPTLSDVDKGSDLSILHAELAAIGNLNFRQKILFDWLSNNFIKT